MTWADLTKFFCREFLKIIFYIRSAKSSQHGIHKFRRKEEREIESENLTMLAQTWT